MVRQNRSLPHQPSCPDLAVSCPRFNCEDSQARLDRIERLLQQLVQKSTTKTFYSVEEFGQLAKRASFTVRQWCNEGRINAEKSMTQSGSSTRWVISQVEYDRYSREGLLPLQKLNGKSR